MGISSLMIACKLEEVYCPILEDYTYICEEAFDRSEILVMEALILKTLNYDIAHTTSIVFLAYIQKLVSLPHKEYCFAQYLLLNAKVEGKCLKYNNLHLALSTIFLVQKIYKRPFSSQFYRKTKFSEIQIKICARDIYFSM